MFRRISTVLGLAVLAALSLVAPARRDRRYGQRNPLGDPPSDEPSRFVTP
jgi:hypothetical protein